MPLHEPDSASTALRWQTDTQSDCTVIHCAGGLTAEHSAELKNYVKDLMPCSKQIVLDLKEVTRMDSAGLGIIVGLYVSARKAKCGFVLINYNKSIRDLLGITNLLSVFEACGRNGVRFP
ncbi:MAG TPA: STAS domain-containing protein [Candidatus Acidoferrales bacterium]|nr:STAS domain-containing protein [Candidatus Acidoferrales bacterium]